MKMYGYLLHVDIMVRSSEVVFLEWNFLEQPLPEESIARLRM
jgi:hypothetical protein